MSTDIQNNAPVSAERAEADERKDFAKWYYREYGKSISTFCKFGHSDWTKTEQKLFKVWAARAALSAPVAAQPDVTQQTLDDVMAGIPARDAEIAALRKEIETLKATIGAEPVAVPKGWKLVPIEPTDAMLLAGYSDVHDTEIWWSLMLNAAPAGPVATPAPAFSVGVRGVGVIDDNPSALAVYFNAAPNDDDIRALHEIVSAAQVATTSPALAQGEARMNKGITRGKDGNLAQKDGPEVAAQAQLDDYHLRLVLDMYDNAMQKAFDGREFKNPCSPGTTEEKAWDIGTKEGQKKRALGLPNSIVSQQPVSGADQFRDAAQMIEPSGNSGELPDLTIQWHDTPEAVHRLFWEKAAIENGLTYEELIEGAMVGETEVRHKVDLTYDQEIQAIRDQKCWGCADTDTNQIHAWAAPDVDRTLLIHMLAHEIGHLTGEPHPDDIQEELRAETFGKVAATAYQMLQAQQDADKVDAERWRAYRAAVADLDGVFLQRLESAMRDLGLDDDATPTQEQVDAAIDAARKEQA
ncbi:hypothetical protein [Alcaligenes aquatilis]|uniref:hypothetical protein n=1 Tax=Alcaligenes aquatilis TaxID=323284 RepID=UPI0036083368